jgi:hypothetical protein
MLNCCSVLFPGICRAETVPITYVEADGKEHTVEAEIGKNLLDVAHDNNVELEGTWTVDYYKDKRQDGQRQAFWLTAGAL